MRRPPASRFDESMTHSRPQDSLRLTCSSTPQTKPVAGRRAVFGGMIPKCECAASGSRHRHRHPVLAVRLRQRKLGADSQPPSKTPSPGRTDGPTAVPRGANATQFHIGDAAWPVDLEGAAALYDDMPAKFKTRPVERMPMVGGRRRGVRPRRCWSHGLVHGSGQVPSGRPECSGRDFGMTMSCDKTTYQGTATPDRGGFGPAFGSRKSTDPWWFACQVTGWRDPRNPRLAVGWTSGDLGWLTITPDRPTSRELLEVLAAPTHG